MFERPFSAFSTTHLAIEISNLPEAFHGFRIAQLSDLHINHRTPLAAIEKLIEHTNHIEPDIVAITGDVIDAKARDIEERLRVFERLEAPTYFVSGNHDLFKGLDALREILCSLGVIDLDNRSLQLENNGEFIDLIGLSDRMSRFFHVKRDPEAVLIQRRPGVPCILLAHQPKDIQFATRHDVDLQISGHTHGGQIYPFHHLIHLDQPFLHGHHRLGKTQIYVSRGIGTWGPPFRFLAKSEIPLISLYKQRTTSLETDPTRNNPPTKKTHGFAKESAR